MRGLRAVAFVVVVALITTMAWAKQAPKAFAADQSATDLVAALDGATNSFQQWSQGLGTVGKLADALPAVQSSAGSVLGFTDLVHKWFNNGSQHLAAAQLENQLNIDEDINNLGVADGRTGHLTTALDTNFANGDRHLTVTLTASKTAQDQPLRIPVPIGAATNAPQSAFSSQGGVSLKVDFSLTFTAVWDHDSHTVYFLVDNSTPSLHVDASASIANIANVSASIGILGVSLAGDSTLNVDAHFVGTLNDPNNDGRVAFENTDHSAGELAASGSLAGLLSFGFGTPAGNIHDTHLHLQASTGLSFPLNLPDINTANVAIDVSWPDISVGSPTITPTANLDGIVGKFLNMTPRDIGDGLGQLSSALTMLQQAKQDGLPSFGNLDLPFIKGSLSDAIQINEVLKKFLADNTDDGSVDPAKTGDPKFASIQDLFDRLKNETANHLAGTGESLGISGVGFDPSNANLLRFKVELKHDPPAAPVDLNVAAAAASGGPNTVYGDTTLADNDPHHKPWTAHEWKNHHVVAGTSGATIADNDANTLTLTGKWAPTTPSGDSAYVISQGAGDIGSVQFGDSLKTNLSPTGQGISKANAVNSSATVTPSYDAHITLALNLQPPQVHNPPLQVQSNDGTTTLESVTPIGADRVLVDTNDSDLFHADMPMDASIDMFANAGFLQVELKGQAHVCEKDLVAANCVGSPTGHMLQVSFKPQGAVDQGNGDGTLPAGYQRFGDIVHTLLHNAGDLLSFDVNVGATGSVDATVPGTTAGFLPAAPHVKFHWNDLTNLTPAANASDPGPYFDLSQLNPFNNFDFDPTNPKALFSILLKTLQTLDTALGSADPGSGSVFNTKIPVIGRSLGDLLKSDESGGGPSVSFDSNSLTDTSRSTANGNAFTSSLMNRSIVVGTQVGIITDVAENKLTVTPGWTVQPAKGAQYVVRSELDDVISILQNSPSDNLQLLIKAVHDRLGPNSPVDFAYSDNVDPAHTPSLIVKLDWKRDFHTSAPLSIDFPLGKVAGVQGSGTFSIGVGGEINVGLVIPLQAGNGPPLPSDLKILDDSSINVHLNADVSDGSLSTTLGPLSISLGNPKSNAPADKAQAHAKYSLDLKETAPTHQATDFTSFITSVAANVNASSQAVTCGLPGETSNSMALCASLPLFISDNGGNTYDPVITTAGHSNAFTFRLPKSTSPATDYFNPSGAQIDGHDRFETPNITDLTAALESRLINFTRLDGIDSYLNLIETSLNTASFGGKLPLIGNDLQQGADFIGKLRNAFHTAIGQLPANGHLSDLAAVRQFITNQLGTALTNAHVNPDFASIDTLCADSNRLGEVTTPTVAPHSGATDDGVTYSYKIVSYITVGTNKEPAKASPAGLTAHGPTALDNANNTIDVSWTPAAGANGYFVYRDTGGGTFKKIGDVDAGSNSNPFSFNDNSTRTATDTLGADPANDPVLHDCSFDQLDSVEIKLDVSHGDTTGDLLKCDGLSGDHKCIEPLGPNGTVPLDIGIPGLSLRADKAGDGPKLQLGYRLHLAFGISRSRGFFVDTKEGNATPQPELALGLNFTMPSQIDAQLAFINITATNCTDLMTADCVTAGQHKAPTPADAASTPLFGGTFRITLQNPDNAAEGFLTLSDLGSASLDDLIKVKLHAAVNIDWLLQARPGDDAGFPGIQAEFQMKWAWNNTDPTTDTGSGLDIGFRRVQIDAGAVFGHILGPIIHEIKTVTGPLDPVIKTLYAPIPVLSDLSHLVGGDDVTIVSIAKAFSTIAGGPDLTFVDRIVKLVQVIKDLPDGSNSVKIPIGEFDVTGTTALTDTATPDNTQHFISGNPSLPSILGNLDSAHDSGHPNPVLNNNGDTANSEAAKAGFTFPVFQKPATLFNLLMGGDVDLVKFDSGPLKLGFDWRQEFGPVYAPPPVLITLHGSASVTLHIVAGFDTYGIRKAFEAVRNGAQVDLTKFGDVILQSLFFYTTDEQGKPLPVVSFTGSIAAGAEVSAVIITVGIEGGVQLTISFLWNDPNNDGKFRLSEFLQTVLNNPICLFTVSGQVSVFLKLFVKIGIGPFSVSFDFTIVNVTLLDFSVTPDCTPPPPKLGGVTSDGHTLVVYAGQWGHTAQRGNVAYDSGSETKEKIKITEVHDWDNGGAFKGVAIEMLGIRREFDGPIQRVVVDGRNYDKPMLVTFLGDGKQDVTKSEGGPKPPTASFDLDAIVFGSSADDVIKTGIGNSWVDGRDGKDIITTGDRTVLVQDPVTHAYSYVRADARAIVAGGPDDDVITVGNGKDTVAGDSSLDLLVPLPTPLGQLRELKNDGRDFGDPLSSGDGQNGPNNISVPNWNDPLFVPADGGATGGNDAIKAGLGQDTVWGNGGNDTLGVGADNQLVSSLPQGAPQSQKDLFVSQGAILVGGNGSDHISGGTGTDTIFTGPQQEFGVDDPGPADAGADAANPNVADTGTGNDHVYGSAGSDLVSGRSEKTQSDDIRGGAGNDVLIGGFGTDKIYGGPDKDTVIAEPSDVTYDPVAPNDGFGPAYVVKHLDLPANTDPSVKTLVGGTDTDHIIGGNGGATIFGDEFHATGCVAGSPLASDSPDETITDTPNDGADKIIGGSGVDNVSAEGGNDFVDAKANTDAVCGESGNDVLRAGADADQVWGGNGIDVINGDSGNDKLYGNNGNDFIYGGDGVDQIEGNDNVDWISGGNDDDIVIGGTRAAGKPDTNDFLFGDNGLDTIIGDNGNLVSGQWIPLDLGTPAPPGGDDFIWGGANDDTCYGGVGNDTILAGSGNDHCEGNNGNDLIYGEAGEDELIGGSSLQPSTGVGYPDGVDTINGGTQNDVITGDNAIVTAVAPAASTDTVQGRGFANGHAIQLLDLGYTPAAANSAGDVLHGNEGNDVVYGQGGNDAINGDANDDYAEGGPGIDTIAGDAGNDDLVGGSSTVDHGVNAARVGQPDAGDIINGNDDSDVVIGDNGKILRDGTPPSPLTNRPGMTPQRAIVLYDLNGSGATSSAFGDDLVNGDNGVDVILGQSGTDRLKGNAGDDYVEGDQGSDAIEGNTGNDDLVGGSSTVQSGSGTATVGQPDTADAVWGGPGDDVITGDNALVLRTGPRTSTTDRLGTDTPGTRMTSRNITLYDLNGSSPLATPNATQFGDDRLSGGSGVDVAYGQDGNDQMSGGPNDDYLEGNGGDDILRGDVRLDQPPTTAGAALTTPLVGAWPGTASAFADLEGAGPDGQDDMMGGSALVGFRDGNDNLEGDGESDFQLGDNGTLKRDVQGADGTATQRVFVQRYDNTVALPANAAVIRMHDPVVATVANSNNTTRFCTTAQATCETTGAFGNDTMFGDGGDDTMWGQDGNDVMHGGAQNDDVYGELGDDTLFGDDGNDVVLGDRGGAVDERMNPDDIAKQFVDSTNNPPKETYTGLRQGTLDHRVDLLHDIDGDAFVGTSTAAAMPHPGLTEGGTDRIRGGNGQDNIHAGWGDDLANGDSGGDYVFGDDGADVLWGGKGCDQTLDTAASAPDCYPGGVFDRTARGTNDRFVDHMFGGIGGSSPGSVGKKGDVGADIMDWRPRGTYTPGTGCTANPFPDTIGNSTVDPCSWFEMTDTTNAADVAVHQHHQGTDWMYGGWDRDVMQGDVAANGPNPGDRLLDWTGAYNLYTHCNSAYGGFNDVRQHSPDMQQFLQQVSYGDGAGQVPSDTSVSGTSAFRELALVYPSDNNGHGSGSDFPSTPGHFDVPSCAD